MPAKNNRGFTLIELLVVISIVALIASVVIVAMNSVRSDSRDAKRIADIKQISSALEIYFGKWGWYPLNDPEEIEGGYEGGDYEAIPLPDIPHEKLLWDSSCGGGNPNDEFLTPLQDAGIMLTLPDDPFFKTTTDCYLYSSSDPQSGDYINGYYLMAKLENTDNASNNCDVDFDFNSDGLSEIDRFCVMNKH